MLQFGLVAREIASYFRFQSAWESEREEQSNSA
jgi:hypothetical protein